jgi:hypothetical protein
MANMTNTNSRRRNAMALILLLSTAGSIGCGGGSSSSNSKNPVLNPIQTENAKAGDPNWLPTSIAQQSEIEGYASAVSVNRGGSIQFFVSTGDASFDLDIYRMGWYGGAGARRMMSTVTLPGTRQPMPTPDPVTGLIECQWTNPYTLNVPNNVSDPTDWLSGIYLARLTGIGSGKQSFIVFVVRDDARPADILFQSSVTTYEAYNDWGGLSLYTTPPAYKVSFNRPYHRDWGAGDFVEWEINMVRFLEREGYDTTYSTDVDTHEQGNLLLKHKAFLSVGHDEYWTWQMRDNVEGARDQGVNLAFFAANVSYWQIRFELSLLTGDADRTIVCYKLDAPTKDPYYSDGNSDHRHLVTTQFRLPPVNRPENAMVGIMYANARVAGDIVVTDPSNWVFQNTGAQSGQHLTGLLGYEVDHTFPGSPSTLAILAESPYVPGSGEFGGKASQRYIANTTEYTSGGNSTVFAAGSMQWNWGLDDFGVDHAAMTDGVAQQATRNVLQHFGATVPGR